MKKTAQFGMIILFSLTILFHLLVMVKVIPYSLVWGGRLGSDDEMYRLESVSLFINVLFMMIILVKSQVIRLRIRPVLITAGLWFMLGMFLLNTLGNLLSENSLEKLIFTPVTVLLSGFTLVLLFGKEKSV